MRPENDFFAEQIDKLINDEWKIYFDPQTYQVKIVNKSGTEMDPKTFGYLFGKLEEYSYKNDETLGKQFQKEPLDEFTIRRLDIQDYVLIKDEQNSFGREFTEIYHDTNNILTLQNRTVVNKNGRVFEGFSAYLLTNDVEKMLPTLQSFIEKNK